MAFDCFDQIMGTSESMKQFLLPMTDWPKALVDVKLSIVTP